MSERVSKQASERTSEQVSEFIQCSIYSVVMLFLDLTALFADSLEEEVTFLSLKSRIVELLLQALLTESDAPNTQMLLGESVHSCAQHTDVTR